MRIRRPLLAAAGMALSLVALAQAAERSDQLFPAPSGLLDFQAGGGLPGALREAVTRTAAERRTEFKNAIPKEASAGEWELNLQPEGVAAKVAEGYAVIVPVHETDDTGTRVRMERWVFAEDGARANFVRAEKLTERDLGIPGGTDRVWERVVGRRAVVASGSGRKLEPGQPYELNLEGVIVTFTEGEFRPLVAPQQGSLEIRGLVFVGKGHVKYTPPDRFQKQYLWHFLQEKKKPVAWDKLEALEGDFTLFYVTGGDRFSQREVPMALGMDPSTIEALHEASDEDPFLAEVKKAFREMGDTSLKVRFQVRDTADPGSFRFATNADTPLGSISFDYDPTDPIECNLLTSEKKNSMLNYGNRDFLQVGRFHRSGERAAYDDLVREAEAKRGTAAGADAEMRAQALAWKQEHENKDLYFLDKISGVVTIGNDAVLEGRITLDTTTLARSVDRVPVTVSHSADLKYVRTAGGALVPYIRFGSSLMIYPTSPWKKDEKHQLMVAYRDTEMIDKVSPTFFTLAGFGAPWVPYYQFWTRKHMDLVTRVPAKFKALGVGKHADTWEEAGFRADRWTTEFPIEFPVLMVGVFHDPVKVDLSMNVRNIPVNYYHGTDSFSSDGFFFNLGPRQVKGSFVDAVNSLDLFEQIFGPYPYPKLDLVSSPLHGGSAQSPPSLVFVGPIFNLTEAQMAEIFRGDPSRAYGVVAHEVAHQWWGSVIAPQNDYHYWWVESLAEVGYGMFLTKNKEDAARFLPHVAGWRKNAIEADPYASIMDASSRGPNPGYQGQVYNKGPYIFYTIERIIGQKVFYEYLRSFVAGYYGQDVTTRDFQNHLQKVTGLSWEWFFDDWVRGTGIPHYRFSWRVEKGAQGDELVMKVDQTVWSGKKVREGDAMRALVPTGVYYKDGSYEQVNVPVFDLTQEVRQPVAKPVSKVVFNELDAVLCVIEK